ncbi:MAG TPA: hypothetical protein VEV81_10470, partial [Pyrinomonadaceae bacterium]|nr:hypothetical protein [Pyrinomonadaceae bacterium]
MLLERIADAENIEVSDEEIEAEINELAASSRQAPEQVRAALTKQGGTTSIADRLRNRKALDLIVSSARVTDEEWREEAEEEEIATAQENASSPEQTEQQSEATDEREDQPFSSEG